MISRFSTAQAEFASALPLQSRKAPSETACHQAYDIALSSCVTWPHLCRTRTAEAGSTPKALNDRSTSGGTLWQAFCDPCCTCCHMSCCNAANNSGGNICSVLRKGTRCASAGSRQLQQLCMHRSCLRITGQRRQQPENVGQCRFC